MHPNRLALRAAAHPPYRLAGLILAAVIVAACGSASQSPAPRASVAGSMAPSPASAGVSTPLSDVSATPTAQSTAGPDTTVWLCKPDIADNPCLGNLDVTAIDAAGKSSVEKRPPAANAPVDCFYVYPTVSRQTTTNANLHIDPEERAVALAQAAQFSGVCDVYAPVYRQITGAAIVNSRSITLGSALTAYGDVANAFSSYLAHYNHGRGIVFIGHSQGAMMLIELLKNAVDPSPDVRKLLVSALLMGGNVKVPSGKVVGGDFANISACGSSAQTGCVVGYSTFDQTPPLDAVFGRANSGLGPLSSNDPNLRVLCVNPAAPGGGSGPLTPLYPTGGVSSLVGGATSKATAATPFVAYPGEYTAECRASGDRTWLAVARAGGTADPRPGVRPPTLATWGLHVVDINIALGNLVELVRAEAAAYN